MQQTSLFDGHKQNVFTDRRICITGNAGNKSLLKKRLLEVNASQVDYNILTKSTHYLITGESPDNETMKRLTLYQHDGFLIKLLTLEDVDRIFAGHTEGYETDINITKHLKLTREHYYWEPPALKGNDEDSVKRVSSPLPYDYPNTLNPIVRKEIFVPGDGNEKRTCLLRQIIGNLGAYANREFFQETELIMLSETSFRALMDGEENDVLQLIEKTYNQSKSNVFNYQFTNETDFLCWLEKSAWCDGCRELADKYKE